MAKSKQPYIPFYVGDYLKDTRILPLAVRGAWVDLIMYMWDAPVRGELIGTIEEYARMMGCEKSEADFALNLLKQKSTADFTLLNDGQIKIESRKMKRDLEISQKRSEAGKNGVDAKLAKQFAEAKHPANTQQNTEYEYDIEFIENNLKSAFDEIYLERQKMQWPQIDFDYEFIGFCEKVRGSPEKYKDHDTGSLRLALQSQLRYAKKKKPTPPKTKFVV